MGYKPVHQDELNYKRIMGYWYNKPIEEILDEERGIESKSNKPVFYFKISFLSMSLTIKLHHE